MTKARILVVEDEPIVAMDIQRSLGRLGYVVLGAVSSGREAIRRTAEGLPDIVLMDIVLKGEMDGVEAARQIRERFKIPVVYLTAHGDEGTLERAKITGPFGYIVKPFDETELRTTIEIALHRCGIEEGLRKDAQDLQEMNLTLEETLVAFRRLQHDLVAGARRAAMIEAFSAAARQMRRPLMSMSLYVDQVLRRGQEYKTIYPLVEKMAERIHDMQVVLKDIKTQYKWEEPESAVRETGD
jgi:CheY-like chemotaxis protein